jgi:hypothetical protein
LHSTDDNDSTNNSTSTTTATTASTATTSTTSGKAPLGGSYSPKTSNGYTSNGYASNRTAAQYLLDPTTFDTQAIGADRKGRKGYLSAVRFLLEWGEAEEHRLQGQALSEALPLKGMPRVRPRGASFALLASSVGSEAS